MPSRRLVVLLSAVLLCCAVEPSARAFMTFAWAGGAIHAEICRDALSPLGVGKGSLKTVIEGCNSQDIPLSKKFSSSPAHHCDDNNIENGHRYWTSTIQDAINDAGNADKSWGSRARALYAIGEALHTVQDFYSHSNYVEYLLKNNLPLKPIDWNNVPVEIRTGYYFYRNIARNESTSSRDACVAWLTQKNAKLKFHTVQEYHRRLQDQSLAAAESYVLEAGDLLHLELNKDSRKTLEGKVPAPDGGRSLHDVARQLAELDTARQWKAFETAIGDRYGERAEGIMRALKGSDVSR